MRHAARKDANHDQVKAILSRYFTVRDCSDCPGLGCDLIIEQRGGSVQRMWMIEIKDGLKKQLTESETWNKYNFFHWYRINSIEHAIHFCKMYA